jgi:hypothetical protein
MLFKYDTPRHSKDEILAYTKKMQLSYWGVFLVYLVIWFFIWRMCVVNEMM